MDLGTVYSSNALFKYSTSNATGPFTMTMSGITTGGFTITSDAAAAGSNNLMIFMAIQRVPNPGTGITNFFRLGSPFMGGPVTFTPSGFSQRSINYIGASSAASGNNTINRTSTYADSIQLIAGDIFSSPPTFTLPGTITTNSAGTAVTGSSTFFHRVASGDSLVSLGNTIIGTIASITSNTALTLTANAASTYPAGTQFGVIRNNHNYINFGDQPNAADSNVFSSVHNFDNFFAHVAYVSGGVPTIGVGVSYYSPTDVYSDRSFTWRGYTPTGYTASPFKQFWALQIADDENYNEARRGKHLGD
jgi:hypothetical protein